MVSCSKFWGNLEEFGEILGKYRNLDGRSLGSIGLSILVLVLSNLSVNKNVGLYFEGD